MKRHIIKTGLLLFATFLFFSCNDDFLERYPLDTISDETYWNTENDLLVYNNSLYDMAGNEDITPIMLGNANGKWGGYTSIKYNTWWLDAFSDNLASMNGGLYNFVAKRSGKDVVPDGTRWLGSYKGWNFVRAINVGLANYNRADVAQSVIDKYAGEARLFRGWFYADMVSRFGDASWVEEELNIDSEELYAARTPREEVMEKVLTDLTFACEKLPDDWHDGNAPGRLNRWAALLVKARLCLFEGTWRKYHGGTNPNMWLQEAADASKELIENGPYSLYVTGDPDHDYNSFHQHEADLKGVSEVIYWRKYMLGIKVNCNMPNWRQLGATKSMVEDYLCTDGLPISLSPLYQGDETLEDVFVNRDPRLRQSVLHPADQDYYAYGKSGIGSYDYPQIKGVGGDVECWTGYHLVKAYNGVNARKSWGKGTCPAIILRLGEAMLIYPEAKAELGTITQDDIDMSINQLRDRVGMPHLNMSNVPVDPRYTTDGVSPLIVEIRRERRVELFMEGFRYDDLRRWKQGKKLEKPSYGMRWDAAAKARWDPEGKAVVKTSMVSGVEYIDVYKETDWENPVFDEGKSYLWPIPLSVISQNTNIKQNPGW